MPEGDTVHKIARAIAQDLEGQECRIDYLRAAPSSALNRFRRVERVWAFGKHLLVEFEHGWSLRVHLGMYGRWERFRDGRKVRPRRDTGVILRSGLRVLVCQQPKDAEVFPTRETRFHPILSRLGPDLLADEPDYDEIVIRAEALLDQNFPLSDLLIDQRVACGLGNVYRNELCFWGTGSCETGFHPSVPWGKIGHKGLVRIYRNARGWLLSNLGGWPRTTKFDGRSAESPGPYARVERLWVYGRAGKCCDRCGAILSGRHLGDFARATTWCSGCQVEQI